MDTDKNIAVAGIVADRRMLSISGLLLLLMLSLLLAPAQTSLAQDGTPQLRSDHPQEYIVQPGDTLWDLASKFLIRPWEWPAIWQANPQVENPHLIYPGDVLNLSYLNGRPMLQVVRRSPEIRVVGEEPISAIPLDALRGFLRWPRLVSNEDMDNLPYVLANEEQSLLGVAGDKTYVRGLTVGVGTPVVIARHRMVYQTAFHEHSHGDQRAGGSYIRQYKLPDFPGRTYPEKYRRDSMLWRQLKKIDGKDRDIIGHELFEVATATVVRDGEVSILQIDQSKREVKQGDYVLPLEDYAYEEFFEPKAMDTVPANARIIGIVDVGPTASHNDIVVLNVGADDGVAAGHVFAVMNPGEEIKDPVRGPTGSFKRIFGTSDKINVTLPNEYIGRLMVYRSYDHISYALIMDGQRDVHDGDLLANPSRVF
jgi:hypothetical protein